MKKRKYEDAAETLKALAHPARLEMVTGLMKDECSVAQIQKALGLPQSTISQHLRILRERKIIRARKDGTRRCYSVVDERAKSIARALC